MRIGILLILGRWLKVAVYLLLGQFVGVFAPLVLFTGRLFDGPHNAPTLEGQYVLKDFILFAAALVVVSTVPGLLPGADPHPGRAHRSRQRPLRSVRLMVGGAAPRSAPRSLGRYAT